MRLLIAIYVPVDCHMWPCCGPGQLPHMGQFCACSLPCMCLLIAISVPVDCHIWASCLPHKVPLVCHMWPICGPDNGHMWASRGPALQNACGPHVCLTWEAISTATCGPCVAHLWNVCWEEIKSGKCHELPRKSIIFFKTPVGGVEVLGVKKSSPGNVMNCPENQ